MKDLYLQFQRAIDDDDQAFLRDWMDSGRPFDHREKHPYHGPLHWACYKNRLPLIRELLERGASVDYDVATEPGNSYLPIHAAAYGEHDALVELLIERGSPVDLATCVFRRDREGALAVLAADPEALTRRVWHIRYSVLHFAADTGRADMVEFLVDQGLDANVRDRDGHAPMYYAARNSPDLDVMQALLAQGADPNHASRTGITPLTAACRHLESLPTVRWLLAHGADPNQSTKDGTTPLHKAVANKVLPMAEALLEAGADPHLPGKKKETPIDLAERKKLFELAERMRAL